jgi:hypothetical protein
MSWLKGLFVSKKEMALREKAKEIWRNICASLKDLGEELVLYEEKEDGFCEARTLEGPGLIRIMANFADQISVSVEVLRLMRGDYKNGYLDVFLNERRTFAIFFKEDFDGIDPAALAQEFRDLAKEYAGLAGRIQEIRGEAERKKGEIDKYAREQIRQP